MKLIGFFLVRMMALLVTAYLVPGFDLESYQAAFVAVIVMGLINTFIKPVIMLITLPITFLTLGLFAIVLNLAFLSLAAAITPGFVITGFVPTLIGAVVLALVSTFLEMLVK